jgi:hypothetical protein
MLLATVIIILFTVNKNFIIIMVMTILNNQVSVLIVICVSGFHPKILFRQNIHEINYISVIFVVESYYVTDILWNT